MENKFGLIVCALHGKKMEFVVAELLNLMRTGFYADIQLRREACRGGIKTRLVPGCSAEGETVPLHEPSQRTKANQGEDEVLLFGKRKPTTALPLVELESIHAWALSEDRYSL
jgi:hypothetical protein